MMRYDALNRELFPIKNRFHVLAYVSVIIVTFMLTLMLMLMFIARLSIETALHKNFALGRYDRDEAACFPGRLTLCECVVEDIS